MLTARDTYELEKEYRELYWDLNELQTIGNEACMAEAAKLSKTMAYIAEMLGYVPAC
jgi:hypothetical protein